LSKAAAKALALTNWRKIDATTDTEIARQIASNPDAAPDMAPVIDVPALRRATSITQAEFAAAYHFSVRTVQEWERGSKRPSGRRGRSGAPSTPISRAQAGARGGVTVAQKHRQASS
jgi:putative transcriptional regulator